MHKLFYGFGSMILPCKKIIIIHKKLTRSNNEKNYIVEKHAHVI